MISSNVKLLEHIAVLKKTFQNQDYKINFSTNNAKLLSLVENYLDFGGKRRSKNINVIDITILVDDFKSKKETLFFPKGREKKNQWQGSICANIAEINVDSATRNVRSYLHEYDESIKEQILYFAFFKPIKFILSKEGLYDIHAATVRRGNDCFLICGPQHAGKSTISLLLSQAGFELLADDDCFIKTEHGKSLLYPFPTKVGIKENLLKNKFIKSNITRNFVYGGKKRISMKKFYAENKIIYDRRVVIFPKYIEDSMFSMKLISRQNAVRRLFKENPNLNGKKKTPRNISKIIKTYSTLVKDSKCLEIIYNDKTIGNISKALLKL